MDEGFVGATLDRDALDGGMGAYSFFGDLGAADDTLEGALEEGLEAPPEEEALDPDLLLDGGEDLSYASMFAAALGEERAPPPSAAPAAPAAEQGFWTEAPAAAAQEQLPQLPVQQALPPSSGVSLFEGLGVAEPTPPPKHKPGSIALGGLLAGTPGGLDLGGIQRTSSPFGSTPGDSGGGYPSFSAPPPAQLPQQDPSLLMQQLGGPPPVVSSLPGLDRLRAAPRAMTAQELEAQLLGGGAGQQQQQQQQLPLGPPPQQQQHQGFALGMPGGMPPGAYPQHMQQQQQPYMQPPLHMGQLPPGYGFPPGGPGMGLGPMARPGVFTPDMIAQAAAAQQQWRPVMPPHQQQQQHMPPGELGGIMAGGPMMMPGGPMARPGAHHMQPGGINERPPMPHMRPPGPPLGSAWARPPPGMPLQPLMRPPPQHMQHANLAQRLRALNLADREEPEQRHRPMLRRRHSSMYMSQDDIEGILNMQWRPLHQGPPYMEDYYYQAFVFKHYGRRNRRIFAPESVRELAPTEKTAADEVAFVRLDGLGRMPFSNVRRPRPLMDITADDLRKRTEGGGGGEDEESKAGNGRRLAQEPLLAARIMIEDCMCLVLDVQDIDQIFVAAAGGAPPDNEAALLLRRTLLMEGLGASMRLPEAAVRGSGAEAAAAAEGLGDGVFLRLMAVPKGKNLLARALRLLYPPPELVAQQQAQRGVSMPPGAPPSAPPQRREPTLRILWALLRNLRSMFAGKPGSLDDAGVSAKVAASAAAVMRQLHSPAATAEALAAVVSGDLDGTPLLEEQPEAVLLPLFAPGAKPADSQFPWLSEVLAALLQRAAELDLGPQAEPPSPEAGPAVQAWQQRLPALQGMVLRHVQALREAAAAAAALGEPAAAAEVRALVPINLVRALLPHSAPEQQQELRALLHELGA